MKYDEHIHDSCIIRKKTFLVLFDSLIVKIGLQAAELHGIQMTHKNGKMYMDWTWTNACASIFTFRFLFITHAHVHNIYTCSISTMYM